MTTDALQPPASGEFDIVSTYHTLLASNPELTKPVIAIKALTALLDATTATTAHEIIITLKEASNKLKDSVRNPLPLLAGTHLFLWFVRQKLRDEGGNFDAVRQHLVNNGRVFAQRAVSARHEIAEQGFRYIGEGDVVMTHGASRAVIELLERAQKDIPGRFQVVYVEDPQDVKKSRETAERLRKAGIPVAAIAEGSVLVTIRSIPRGISSLFLGGEVITKDGGMISRMGAAAIAQHCHEQDVTVYACGEEHKFVAQMPGWNEIGFDQPIVDFTTQTAQAPPEEPVEWVVSHVCSSSYLGRLLIVMLQPRKWIDLLITETGVHRPEYVPAKILEQYGSFDG